MVAIDFSNAQLQLKNENDKVYVLDSIRKKWLVLTPEEHIRQCLIQYLINEMHYPIAKIAVEKKILVNGRTKRFDIVVYNQQLTPWILIECKEPSVPINDSVLFQLLTYQRTIRSDFWVITNGHETFCADARDSQNIQWMPHLPPY